MAGSTGRKSGGAKKYGRNLAKCKRYRDAGTRERNRLRRLRRQLKQNPLDLSNPLHPKHRKDYKGPKAKPDASGV